MFPDSTSSKYIFLAEDNPADIELVREALQDRVACDLHIVRDGDRAVSFIERLDRDSTLNCPALLLLDLHLPKRNGEYILRYLRASERCAQTPVVIMSGSGSPTDSEIAIQNAALHYFRKPSTLEEFLALGDVVRQILGRKSGDVSVDSPS